MEGSPLGLRLFLEGLEVPVVAAQISIQPGQPASASIQIVPTDAAFGFFPRTMVHLFALESKLSVKDTQYFQQLYRGNPEDFIDRHTILDKNYILMFCGEVAGISYSKTHTSRSMVLQCMDLSVYWDTCYQWFADYSVGGTAFTDKMHVFCGAKTGLFDNIANGHKWVISQLLNSRPQTPEYSHLKGLLGGMIHLMEAVGGVKSLVKDKSIRGVTDFFTVAEARYKLLGMIGAVENDTTSTQIYDGKAFMDWLRSGMSSIGNLVSFRDLARQVGQYVFHDIYPNPAPFYSAGGGVKEVKAQRGKYYETTAGSIARNYLKTAVTKLEQELKRLANPAEGESIQIFLVGAAAALENAKKNLAGVKTYDVKKVTNKVNSAIQHVKLANALLTGLPAFFPERNVKVCKAIIEIGTSNNGKYVTGALKDLVEDVLGTYELEDPGLYTASVVQTQHLYSQLFLPETFFVAPPRCNVIFPDQFYSFNYSRNFMREVTRVSCGGGLGMLIGGGPGSVLLARYYYAPAIKDAANGKLLHATIGGQAVLLPHEVHSGIIPAFTWVTAANRWGLKQERDRRARLSAEGKTPGDTFFAFGKMGYIQRLAHFEFFVRRWAARQMQVECAFNPYLVVGFPGVVIDKPFLDPDQQKAFLSQTGRNYLPVQFIGKVASISHSIGQDGGRTLVAFSHCRTHRGYDDEFLNTLTREKWGNVDSEVVISVLHLRAIKKKTKETERAVRLLQAYLQGLLKVGYKPPGTDLKVTAVIKDKNKVALTKEEAIRIGIENYETDDAVIKGAYVSVPITIKVRFTSYQILVDKDGKAVTETVKVPIEDALLPGWYSSVWAKEAITKEVYRPLLGTVAIHDDAQVSYEELNDWLQTNSEEYVDMSAAKTITDGQTSAKVSEQTTTTTDGPKYYKFDVGTQDEGRLPSLEVAIDSLAAVYGAMKRKNLNVQEFIYNYTRRPIATIPQVLGTNNLAYEADPTKPNGVKATSVDGRPFQEGFHSLAFGDYNEDVKIDPDTGVWKGGDRAGLGMYLGVEYHPMLRSKTDNDKLQIPPHLDPRGPARARVRVYVEELRVSAGGALSNL